MQYINPIEILGLSKFDDATSIDNELIKREKRKLFANIELSDKEFYEYHGLLLTKGNCEKVIDELSNNNIKEFYLYLSKNIKLNNFLVNGIDEIFTDFKQDRIIKSTEFIKFISPYFAPKFDKTLFTAFQNKEDVKFKEILSTSFLISQSEINIAYSCISNDLQNKIAKISKIRNEITNEISTYTENDIHEVIDLVVNFFPSEFLNSLPKYFESQIINIAKEINYLNIVIWDNFDSTLVCNDLLEHILKLNFSGIDRLTFQKNYDIVRKSNQERTELEIYAPTLNRYAECLIQIQTKFKEIESKNISPLNLLSWVNSVILIQEVNNLPSVFDEIKNQIALSLRAMSVGVWNNFSNIDVSINLINNAINITGLKLETQLDLQEVKKQLSDIKSRIDKRYGTTYQSEKLTNPKHKKSTDENFGFLLLVIIIGVIGILIIVNIKSHSKKYPITTKNTEQYKTKSKSESNSHSKLKLNSRSNSNSISKSSTNFIPSAHHETTKSVKISRYKGNQLKDGASPLDGCFGNGIYRGKAKLTVKNGGNSDAIICLYSVLENRTIRNEYVRKNSSFTMSKIAQGNYKIRVFYGNDWNPNLKNACGTNGNFESDVHFSEFDGTHYFEDNYRGYSNATITLYTVTNGNASTSLINETDFFYK